MSHNKLTVNNQAADSNSNITLNVAEVVNDTPANNEAIVGNASNEYEFGTPIAGLNPLTEYLFVCNTNTGSSQTVTGYGYITQYVDNRSGTVYLIKSGIDRTAQGGEGVNYGGGGTRVHGQLLVDQGTYFAEYYPCPYWTTNGYSEIQYQQGNSGTADVKGNIAYCYRNVPSRNFYARVISTGTNQRVWPKIINNTNQRIGATYSTSQAMIAYKI